MTVLHGDCREMMRTLDANSVDAIVTDPPYGLAFMGKGWDHAVPGVDYWAEAFRVLKPGGHLLAFGGTRTFHRLACAIEDAGFEIRDSLSWLYGSGFPKSLDVGKAIDKAAGAVREVVGRNSNGASKLMDRRPWSEATEYDGSFAITVPATDLARQWHGWGTALKPAWEPIILARKPLDGTVAANVAAHGTGAINVDGCRIDMGDEYDPTKVQRTQQDGNPTQWRMNRAQNGKHVPTYKPGGRWPANVCLDEDAATQLGEPSRFFYVAKASRREREAGLTGESRAVGSVNLRTDSHAERNGQTTAPARNHHPTVKPIALMRWLCRLVTPPGGLVLDPFTGSGTTGCAAVLEGFRFVGCEREADYVAIAEARIAHWSEQTVLTTELESVSV